MKVAALANDGKPHAQGMNARKLDNGPKTFGLNQDPKCTYETDRTGPGPRGHEYSHAFSLTAAHDIQRHDRHQHKGEANKRHDSPHKRRCTSQAK